MKPYTPPKCPRVQSRQERDYPCVYEAGHGQPCAFSATPEPPRADNRCPETTVVRGVAKRCVHKRGHQKHSDMGCAFGADESPSPRPTCSTFEVDEAGIRVCPAHHGHAGPHALVSPDDVLPQVCPRWLAGQHATCACKDCQEAVNAFVKCRSAAEKPMPAAKLNWAFPAAFFDVAVRRGQERGAE